MVSAIADHTWWEIGGKLVGIIGALWFYCFVSRKVFKSEKHFSFEEAYFIVLGFMLAVAMYKWNW